MNHDSQTIQQEGRLLKKSQETGIKRRKPRNRSRRFSQAEARKSEAYFWGKVVKMNSGCWHWRGLLDSDGYGEASISGRNIRAHRVAFVLAGNILPDGMCVCHKCDNRPCVNPDHLFLGTGVENTLDRHKKGRDAPQTGSLNHNSKISEEDVLEIRRRYSSGETQIQIALEFGISRPCVSIVVNRKTWTHL